MHPAVTPSFEPPIHSSLMSLLVCYDALDSFLSCSQSPPVSLKIPVPTLFLDIAPHPPCNPNSESHNSQLSEIAQLYRRVRHGHTSCGIRRNNLDLTGVEQGLQILGIGTREKPGMQCNVPQNAPKWPCDQVRFKHYGLNFRSPVR